MDLREKIARKIEGPNWRVRDAGGISYSSAVKHRTDKSLEIADSVLAIPEIRAGLGMLERRQADLNDPSGGRALG